MRVEGITIHDFKSYQDATVDLTGISLASVVGPNGAGKSSLLEAITFALTGARGLRNLDSFIRKGAEECRVSLTFAMGAQRYRLTRTRSNRNSGKSTVELAREENGLWAADGTGAREIDQRIAEILAVDEDILLLTSIVAQGDAGSFFTLRPAQRLEALGAILKLDEQYQPVEKLFKAATETAKASLEETRRDITRLEADVATLETRELDREHTVHVKTHKEADLEAAIVASDRAEQYAETTRDAVRDTDHVKRRVDEMEQRKLGLIGRRRRLEEERDALTGRTKGRAELEAALAGKADIEAGLTALAEAERADAEMRQQRAVLEADLRAKKQAIVGIADQGKPKASELERAKEKMLANLHAIKEIESAEVPVCDRCGQAIEDEALRKTIASLSMEHNRLAPECTRLETEVADLRSQLAALKSEASAIDERISALPALTYDLAEHRRLTSLLEQLNTIPAKLAEISVCEERLAALGDELSQVATDLASSELTDGLDALKKDLFDAESRRLASVEASIEAERARSYAKAIEKDIAELDKEIARHDEAIKLLGPSREGLEEARARCRALEEEQADADLLRKAFSKWGIPALIVTNVLRSLEREVNELLGLYDGGLAVRFESEKETRDGSRDSLEIIVFDGSDWRPFETFSGGEKYRVASAMRLGLALLLAHRSGARVETLIVDEPEGLDVAGRQHLARILEHMSEHFGLTLLLTHYDDLKDAMPSQVMVSRGDDGLSRVEVLA